MFLRLRQLCLVAGQLEPVVDTLSAVFGVPVAHRDPEVARFGLHNALVALGTSFVEVVAPTREGTAAGRHLQRRGGDGGYMVIFDTDDLPHWRRHVADLGVRVAASLSLGDYEGAQLHPQDTGGALLEINTTRGGAELTGAYAPAGPHWTQSVCTDRVEAVVGAVLQSPDPARLAARWGQILQRSVVRAGDAWHLTVDNAVLRFVPAGDGRGEGLCGVDLRVNDAAALLRAARERNCECEAHGVWIGGVRFAWAPARADGRP